MDHFIAHKRLTVMVVFFWQTLVKSETNHCNCPGVDVRPDSRGCRIGEITRIGLRTVKVSREQLVTLWPLSSQP